MADADLITEEWAAIPFAPGYLVSTEGRVRGKRGTILRPFVDRGYSIQTFCVGGRTFKHTTHFVVCTVFNGPRPKGKPHCAHRDGDRANNRPGNLRWATAKENAADGMALGKYKYGDDHWSHKMPDRVTKGSAVYNAALTQEQAREIRREPRRANVVRDLAERYAVSVHVIGDVRSGRTYRE